MLFPRLATRKIWTLQARTMTTVANLKRISAQDLSSEILMNQQNGTPSKIAVVDVRGDDYIGGHIKDSIHIPSHQFEALLPTLCRKTKDKKIVVFHCMLSQQRGPSAALKYLRDRDVTLAGIGELPLSEGEQQVYVLDRGFQGWQEKFGSNEGLTESYRKELWEE